MIRIKRSGPTCRAQTVDPLHEPVPWNGHRRDAGHDKDEAEREIGGHGFAEQNHRQADADRDAQIALRVGGERAEPRQAHVEQHQPEGAREYAHRGRGNQGLGRRPQGPGMIDGQRHRQQYEPAEQERARGHHHRVVVGQPQTEDRRACKRDGGDQDDDLGKDIGIECRERIEADDHGRSGKPQNGAEKLEQRGRLVPGNGPGDEKGEDRRCRGQHHRICRRHILLRPGDQQERKRRIDGLLLGEQLPGPGFHRHRDAADAQDHQQEACCNQGARRDEGDRRKRAEADLGQRIGRTPAARQREQQRIIAPAATGLWRVRWQRRLCRSASSISPA